MSQFRLHIDIPLGCDDDEAKRLANIIVNRLCLDKEIEKEVFTNRADGVIQWRLGHDEDRQKSNYFNVNENGHVSNKKSKYTPYSESEH